MIQLTDIKQLMGKTIERISLGYRNMALFFEGGTFAVFHLELGYERGDEEIYFCENIENDLELVDQRNLGIITDTEYNALDHARREAWEKGQEEHDRKLYLELRKRFENV